MCDRYARARVCAARKRNAGVRKGRLGYGVDSGLARNKARSGCGRIEFSNVQGEINSVSTYSFDGGGSKRETKGTNVHVELSRLDGRTSEKGQSSSREEKHYVGNR